MIETPTQTPMKTYRPDLAPEEQARFDEQRAADAEHPRQFVNFAFYKLDPAFRRTRSVAERAEAVQELAGVINDAKSRFLIYPYSTLGLRSHVDFFLWRISYRLEDFEETTAAMLRTEMGAFLDTPHSFLAMTGKSIYVYEDDDPEALDSRHKIVIGGGKYVFVYPFVKTRPWYVLPPEARMEAMRDHIRVGKKYPSVKLNTTYSFGLDDQDFVVAFESDYPQDFLDLVKELRETEASTYTQRDTPYVHLCSAGPGDHLVPRRRRLKDATTMTTIAQWQPARLPQPSVGAKGDTAEKPHQFVSFAFYTLDPGWLRFDPATRQAGAQELAAVIEGCRDRLRIHSYTTFGVCAETDFLLWRVSHDLDDFEAMAVAMRRTHMGCWLQTPYSYLGMTGIEARRSCSAGRDRTRGRPLSARLPTCQDRSLGYTGRRRSAAHDTGSPSAGCGCPLGRIGTRLIQSVLGVHDGMLTFETDRPEGFPGLVENLRRTQAGVYAQRDTPIFICIRQEPAAILARVSGI